MRRWLVPALAFILTLVAFGTYAAVKGTTPVKPQPKLGYFLDAKQTEHYLDMAVKYSRYKKPWFARPKIDVVPVGKFREAACGWAELDCGILGYTSPDERDVVHVIDTLPMKAVERLGWTRDEIIVHELVHWLEIQSGATFSSDCSILNADESDAYNAQFQYAVHELKASHGFWIPDVYGQCMLNKMLKGRGHH